MKKILSILLTLAVLTTSVTLFAAAVPSDTDNVNVYLDEVKLADGEIEPGTPYRIGSGTETKLAAEGEKLIVQRVDGKKGTLVYDFDKPYNFDYYSFGVNFTIDGFTGTLDETKTTILNTNPGVNSAVFPDRVVEIIDGVGYDKDGKVVSKTAWVFAKSGENTNYPIKIKFDDEGNMALDPETGKVLLTVGDATLKQGTEYKMIYRVDKVNGTFVATVSDGVNETVVSKGQVQNAFSAIAKIEFSIANTVNTETKVTFDNFFLINESPFYIGNSLPVSSDGTVSFGAYVAEEIENPALYINGIKVEDISTTEGVTGYDFVVEIPDNVTYGEAKFEIRGTVGGEAVSYEKTTMLLRADAKKELTASSVTSGTYNEAEGAYEIKETRFNYNDYKTDGIYEFCFDFKTDALKSIKLRVSPDANAKGAWGGANVGNYAVFKHNGSESKHGEWTKAQIEAAGVTLKTDDYNTAVLKMDYTGNAKENWCPYTLTINGVVAFEDEFKLEDTATINGFSQFSLYIAKESTATFGYFRYNGYEVAGAPKAESVMVYYDDASSENGMKDTVSGLFMNNIKVNFNQELSNVDGNISFVNEFGEEMGEVSAEGSVVTVKISEDILPSGTYKLIVDKNVETFDTPIGLNLIIPVEVSSDDQVLEPKQGTVIEGETVQLSAYAKNADKVEFYLNDEKVSGVTNGGSGNIYTATATIEENGIYYFDVYAYGEEGLVVTSSSFAASLSGGKYNARELATFTTSKNADSFLNGAKTLYTGKVAITGTITLPDTTTNTYFNMGTNNAGNLVNSGSEWGGISDAFGYGANTTYLFNADGTMGSIGIPYEANKPYNFRYVIDFNKDVFEFWVDGVKVAEYQSVDTSNAFELCDINMLYFRFQHMGAAGVVYENLSMHTEAVSPVVYDIEADGVSANANGLYIAPAGAEEIVIKLDKAYEEDNLDGLVTVKVDNEVADCSAVYNKAAKTITLTGLAYKASQKIEVTVSGSAKVLVDTVSGTAGEAAVFGEAAAEVGKDLKVTLFTGDSNKICVLPLKLETNGGSDILAYSRYINGSDSDVKTFLIITEYEDPETQTEVLNVKFSTIAIGAGKAGAVSGYLNGVKSAQGCKVMLWDTNFAPLVSVGTIEN